MASDKRRPTLDVLRKMTRMRRVGAGEMGMQRMPVNGAPFPVAMHGSRVMPPLDRIKASRVLMLAAAD